MTLAMHCDRDSCDTWARTDSMGASDFVTVVSDGEVLAHCCCIDCLMQWAATHSEPTQVI